MSRSSSPEKDFDGQENEVSVPAEWTVEEERLLVRKIDWRCLVSRALLVFILNFIRGNMSNARLQGLQEDLHLNDTQYATGLSILFVGYILMQVPSTIVMNSITRPRLFIAGVVTVWGAISALTALCNQFSHLVVCRFWLGFVEAALYPSAVYYLSRWYTRKEIGLRIAYINAGNMLAQGLGGLLAAGVLAGMEGVRGIRGWRWLFIIEGAITVSFGLCIPLFLADYPTTTRWLSARERLISQGRLAKDIGLVDDPDENEKSVAGILRGLALALTDIKVWAMAVMFFTYLLGLSFNAYLPTIAKNLGFSTTITLLLTFPPWAFATVFSLLNSWHSDRTGDKFFHIALSYGFAVLGYIVALTSKSVAGQYIALFGMCMGYSGGFIIIGWNSASIARPPVKRAAAIGFVSAFGNVAQIPTSYLWPTKWGPSYWQSFVTGICLLMFSLSIGLAFRQHLVGLNKKLDRGEAEAFSASPSAADKTANVLNTSVQQEEQLIHSFRYIY
ncbi:MFS general substrate transporter [Schizophyllum amplum]|uniref:MFS general substrate transporter n=1 Tax=Schizophyllum amplum TaxID=97359 RepID=A0A550CHK1_9AGAR|nr:MFS general substrate transporter [Auriculariopsis ampla]